MAILDGSNLAAEALKRATYRVHHVGTKLNEGELWASAAPHLSGMTTYSYNAMDWLTAQATP